jgi:3-methyladenine DNA glycosylase AlkD
MTAIMTMTTNEIITYMESLRNEEQRKVLMRFFKTAPGEYGYGDEFLGLKVPQTREIVKHAWQGFPLPEIPELLMNRWHEVRLCGFLILVAKFEEHATKRQVNNPDAIRQRDEILTMYLQYAEQANNWDLVDLSAPKILGHWLLLPSNLGDKNYKLKVLDKLAASPCLWKQRISIVCTWKTTQQGDPSWCLRYAAIHLRHINELMQKARSKREQSQTRLSHAKREQVRLMSMAVGWMLREMGTRVSLDLLRDFLRQHVNEMPRTMLRYAIERMSETERKEWLNA